ncbi:MAG: GPW/gp25 family protein [Aliarcobacter sp.]|nr:GPW/gp25 family protein [Aliarcobacter sp.]
MFAVSIEDSINRILKTPLGSRVMRPLYGSKLYELRDRQFDERFKTLATKYIFEAIKVNEPRVQVEEVNFKLEPISGKVVFLIYLTNQEEVEVSNV